MFHHFLTGISSKHPGPLLSEPRTCGGEERLGRTAPEDPEGSAAAERGRLLRQ